MLILYTIVNFVEGGAYHRYVYPELVVQFRCSSRPWTIAMYYILVGYLFIQLAFVLKYGNASRRASSIFQETQCIYVASNIGALTIVLFGVFVLFTTNFTLQIMVRGFGPIIFIGFAVSLLFYPKFKAVYSTKEVSLFFCFLIKCFLDENEHIYLCC